jgi:hypothetical protein
VTAAEAKVTSSPAAQGRMVAPAATAVPSVEPLFFKPVSEV